MIKAAPFLDRNKQLLSNLTKYGALILVAILLLLFVIRPAVRALKAASAAADGQKLLTGNTKDGERRNAEPGAARQLEDNGMPELTQMMTVAELEAQMQTGDEPRSSKRVERVETIRKQIAAQTISDTETVVSTMRGWLGESA